MSKSPQRKTRKATAKTAAKPRTTPTAGRDTRKAPAKTASSEWASGVVFTEKEPKLAVSLRLDADVLRFFRGFGSGYQTRINEVLRVFMDAHHKQDGNGRTASRAKR